MKSIEDALEREVVALFSDASLLAGQTIRKFPQPNYVCAKLAEEAGEVIRAYIHMAEGRAERSDLRAEIVQLIALAIRLYMEGDLTIKQNVPEQYK